jgi:hypothetical protein
MMWQDVLLQRAVGDSELRSALAQAFSIPDGAVAVVHSIEEIPAGHPVIAEVRDAQGDFEMALSIYTSAGMESANPVQVIQQLCAALRTTALISDDSLDPYTMLLLGEGAEIHRVELDTESLDRREEYRLARRQHP